MMFTAFWGRWGPRLPYKIYQKNLMETIICYMMFNAFWGRWAGASIVDPGPLECSPASWRFPRFLLEAPRAKTLELSKTSRTLHQKLTETRRLSVENPLRFQRLFFLDRPGSTPMVRSMVSTYMCMAFNKEVCHASLEKHQKPCANHHFSVHSGAAGAQGFLRKTPETQSKLPSFK